MKRLFLTLLLLSALFQGKTADASGSNTVFFPVRFNDYIFMPAIQDVAFNNTTLYNYLESAEASKILVSRVSTYLYRSTYYYTYWGYDVELGFADYETVTFRYYASLGAILGKTSKNEIVVLLPPVVTRPTTTVTGSDTID
ncbi:MAG: hypothetical protein EOP07_16340 [Proteobacteria bacterium]|nr:MAG: hypothetical protein EOP07_16340 [Pseudomonadota bacterium]